MSVEKYVRDAVDNFEQNLVKSKQRLPTCCKTPIMSGYRPETDTSSKLKVEGVTQYRDMVGVIRWAIDLGQVYILLVTSLMSTYLALPRREHFKQKFHVFGYLKVKPKINLCFDPQHPAIDEHLVAAHNLSDFYQDSKEYIPVYSLTPRGDVVSTY